MNDLSYNIRTCILPEFLEVLSKEDWSSLAQGLGERLPEANKAFYKDE